MKDDAERSFVAENLAEPHEALYRLISFAARDLRRVLREDFRAWGLSGAQFGVLLGAGGRANIGDIAEQLLTDATSVGRVVERMEAAGLVERYRELPDRRIVWVRLKPRGDEMLRALLPLHVARCREVFASLPEHERDALAKLLDRVRAGVAPMLAADDGYDEDSARAR